MRANTPNRFSSGNLFKKRNNVPSLKESTSSKHLFCNFGRSSRYQLFESRSSDKFKGVGMINFESSDQMCMNNDGKKAKYRVVNRDES